MKELTETQKLARGLRRRWWVVVFLTALAAGAGYGVSVTTPPSYEAATSVLIGELAGSGLDNSTVKASQSMAQTFSDLARRQPVLQGAVTDAKLATTWQGLRERVSVAVPTQNPQLVSIKVRAPTRAEATATAAAIAKRLVALGSNAADDVTRGFVTTQLTTLQRNIQAAGVQLATVQRTLQQGQASIGQQTELQNQRASLEDQIDSWQRAYVSLLSVRAAEKAVVPRVFEPAEAQEKPVRPLVLPTTALAGLVGLILGIVLVYVLEVRYWVVRSRADTESIEGPRTQGPFDEAVPEQQRSTLARSDLAL